MKKILIEQVSPEKEHYFLRLKDIGSMGSNEIVVKDDQNLYTVKVKNGEVDHVSLPDGVEDFNLDDINSQLKSGSTLGAAITGEKLRKNKLHEHIKQYIRSYILSNNFNKHK